MQVKNIQKKYRKTDEKKYAIQPNPLATLEFIETIYYYHVTLHYTVTVNLPDLFYM